MLLPGVEVTRRLRVAAVIVQPVLVWDDGEHLAPGPIAQPVQVGIQDLAAYPQRIAAELQAVTAGVAG